MGAESVEGAGTLNAFEKQIGDSFPDYEDSRIAHLFFLYPPMRVAGMIGKMPGYIPVGKADYDVAGHYLRNGGIAIGAELKQTKEHESSLPLVAPDHKGNGLQAHQLFALEALVQAGGDGYVLWNNSGEIGRLHGAQISRIAVAFRASLKSKNPARGSRSIPWDDFTVVKPGLLGTIPWILWPCELEALNGPA
jgi:hypothetical protein